MSSDVEKELKIWLILSILITYRIFLSELLLSKISLLNFSVLYYEKSI